MPSARMISPPPLSAKLPACAVVYYRFVTSSRVLFAAAVVILFAQLMLSPVIGVANNGDFSRTYGIFHLTMPVADEVRFADTRYQFDPRVNYFGGFYSSEILLMPPALAMNAGAPELCAAARKAGHQVHLFGFRGGDGDDPMIGQITAIIKSAGIAKISRLVKSGWKAQPFAVTEKTRRSYCWIPEFVLRLA